MPMLSEATMRAQTSILETYSVAARRRWFCAWNAIRAGANALCGMAPAMQPPLNQCVAAYQLVEKLLRQPSASLRGARSLAYRLDMSRSLRAVRITAGHLTTLFNKLLTTDGSQTSRFLIPCAAVPDPAMDRTIGRNRRAPHRCDTPSPIPANQQGAGSPHSESGRTVALLIDIKPVSEFPVAGGARLRHNTFTAPPPHRAGRP